MRRPAGPAPGSVEAVPHLEAAEHPLEAAGHLPEAATRLEAAGHPLEAAGHPMEAAGHQSGAAAGPPRRAAGHPLEAAGHPLEAVGHPLEAVGSLPAVAGPAGELPLLPGETSVSELGLTLALRLLEAVLLLHPELLQTGRAVPAAAAQVPGPGAEAGAG